MSQFTRPGSRHPGPTPTWTDRLRTSTVLTAGGRRTGPRSALGSRLGLRPSGQVPHPARCCLRDLGRSVHRLLGQRPAIVPTATAPP